MNTWLADNWKKVVMGAAVGVVIFTAILFQRRKKAQNRRKMAKVRAGRKKKKR